MINIYEWSYKYTYAFCEIIFVDLLFDCISVLRDYFTKILLSVHIFPMPCSILIYFLQLVQYCKSLSLILWERIFGFFPSQLSWLYLILFKYLDTHLYINSYVIQYHLNKCSFNLWLFTDIFFYLCLCCWRVIYFVVLKDFNSMKVFEIFTIIVLVVRYSWYFLRNKRYILWVKTEMIHHCFVGIPHRYTCMDSR